MKPIPRCLQDMFPCSRPTFAARPWWAQHDLPQVKAARRRDGVVVFNSDLDDMRDRDEALPLPHPGFRVGQVWALMGHDDERLLFVSQIVGYDPDGESGPQENGAWLLGDEWMPEEELADLLEYAFLIADPACPHLAPWSPSSK